MTEVPENKPDPHEYLWKFQEDIARSEILSLEAKLNSYKGIDSARSGRIARMSARTGYPKAVVHRDLENLEKKYNDTVAPPDRDWETIPL